MSDKTTERLLNLVIALLGTRRGHNKEFIRTRVAGYNPEASESTFGRMFERDKVYLKRLGIPVIAVPDPLADDPAAWNYRIRPEDYRIPQIRLDSEGMALLSLAARVWEQASFGQAAVSALRKLETVSGIEASDAPARVESRVHTKEPAFDPLWEALRGHHPVRFGYRKANEDTAGPRSVEPWGLGNKYGQWYLSGLDTDAGAPRLFRLSRMGRDVETDTHTIFNRPTDYDIAADLDRLGHGTAQLARIRVPAGTGWTLRHYEGATVEKDSVERDTVEGTAVEKATGGVSASQEGWETLSVPYREPELMADDLAAMGPAAVVLAPAQLQQQVRKRLSAAAATAGATSPGIDFGTKFKRAVVQKTSEDNLRRLLAMVPYLVEHNGIDVDTVAREFGITPAQVADDFNQLIVCGLPGGLHGDLIDIQWDQGFVTIRDADELAKPLRLTQEEACALLVGLESLKALPGTVSVAALEAVAEQVREVAGDEAWLADVVEARIVPGATLDMLAQLQRLVDGHEVASMDYLVRVRDEVTQRVIEPLRIFSVDSTWYVNAWCRTAGAPRNFRLDGISKLQPTGQPAPVRPDTEAGGIPARLFTPRPTDRQIDMVLQPSAEWVIDAYSAEKATQLADGRLGVRLNVANDAVIPALAARLAGAGQVVAPESAVSGTQEWLARALAGYASVETGTGL